MAESQKFHVAAGTFTVSEKKPIILEAFLGTCVGVALYDTKAGIGGMIHLLLPEPASPDTTYNREKYAATGLPLFLEALYERGATKENLTAHIAGGALVGPVSQQDISLDIGGRTTDVARHLLTEEGIAIKASETGGFFTCCLSLDLTHFETAVRPSVDDKVPEGFSFRRPAPEEIDQAMERLQPIPQVALKILRLINEQRTDSSAIAHEIAQDQVLTAKTLKLCNSAMFAGRVQVDSLEDALLLLGQDLLLKMVISASVRNFYNQSDSGYSLCKGGLYHHAIGTAIIAEKLAEMTGAAAPSTAYTAGLLHDIGMVVLDQYITRACPMFYRGLQMDKNSIIGVEKKILGTSHCEVGRKLARKWNLPGSLSDTIFYHHNPEAQEGGDGLPYIVNIADLIMSRFHSGLELERLETRNLKSRLKRLGLNLSGFSDVVDMIPVGVFGTSPDAAIQKG